MNISTWLNARKLLLSILTMASLGASAQNYEWAKSFGGSTGGDSGSSIHRDDTGNILTTGFFAGTVDFDPGTGVSNLSAAGGSDIYISKLDANGNFIWAKNMGNLNYSSGVSITTDATGNIYTVGRFRATVDFDPGAGVANLTAPSSADNAFILKLDANGNFMWVKHFSCPNYTSVKSIAIDGLGNILTTGMFKSTADFDPGAGTANLSSSGGEDVFVSKLDANGNFMWVKKMGGTVADNGRGIYADALSNVYTTGEFTGNVDFDPGAGVSNLNASGTNTRDIFIQKLDPNGNFLWAKKMGGSQNDYGMALKVDAFGYVYTTGRFSGTADFDPGAGVNNLTSNGSSDIFVSKLAPNGDFVWAKNFGGINTNVGRSITTDNSGNVYTTGNYSGTGDFDPGAGITSLVSIGGNDIFISKLDANGDFVWARAIGGLGGDEFAFSITNDASDNLYLTGRYESTVDFDPNAGVSNLISNGYSDAFVLKLSQGCTVNIPDANFKAYLVGNTAINTNGDTEIQCSEATAFAGTINCSTLSISDLTGIEAFTNLTQLYSWSNSFTSLDVTQNTALIKLDCSSNSLTSLDVTQNTALTYLVCSYNQLSSLNVTQNTLLTGLDCLNNSLSSLDVTQNTLLTTLGCGTNQISSLDVSSNLNLTGLHFYQNNIVNMDLSNLVDLIELNCLQNSLTSLNVANGNNLNFTQFNASSNPNLTCIQVDDVAYSTTNWTNIDAAASFSTNCGSAGINEAIQNFALTTYPNPTNGVVNFSATEQINSIVIYNLTGQQVAMFSNTNTIDISNLPKGMYTAKISIDGKLAVKKIIKE